MLNKINQKIIEAMKAKDSFKADALKMVKTELQNNQKSKSPQSEISVISSYYKKLAKGLEIENADFVAKVKAEMAVVAEFVPKELTDDEIRVFISKHSTLPSNEIMKNVKKDIEESGNLFDGKRVRDLVMQK